MKIDQIFELSKLVKSCDSSIAKYINYCVKNNLTNVKELQNIVKKLNEIDLIMRGLDYED